MKNVALGAILIGLLAACGGGDDGDDVTIDPDANTGGPDAASAACNPVSQTGCATGEKCTWIEISDTLGKIGCVADGTVALGGACAYGAQGETTGFDDCVAGNICIGGACEEICTATPDSCPTTSACSQYSGLFDGFEVQLGACDFKCSPGPQTRTFDDGAACGGTTERPKGCYGWAWGTTPIEFTCTPDISDAAWNQPPSPLAPSGNPYLNSCDAGFIPWISNFDDTVSTDVCIAWCQPVETHSGATGGALGQSPFSCGDRGATTGTDGGRLECRYLHVLDNTPDPALNNSGMCWSLDAYQAEWITMGVTEPMPACTSLSNTTLVDSDGDGTPDMPEHLYWGCAPWPTTLVSEKPVGGFRAKLEKIFQDRLQRQAKPSYR